MVFLGFLRKRVINIKIQGLINQNKAFKIYSGLSKAKSYNVQAVVLSINSPYGSLVQANNILECIKSFTNINGRKLPFFTFAEDYCLNSGNLLLAGGDKAFVNKFSLLGDIGYVQTSYGLKPYLNSHQIQIEPIGNNKNKISRLQPLQEKSKVWINERLKFLQLDLKSRIQKRRPDANLQKVDRVLSATEAIKLGLADQIRDRTQFLESKFKGIQVHHIDTQETGLFSYDSV